jgi:hypothetical protein
VTLVKRAQLSKPSLRTTMPIPTTDRRRLEDAARAWPACDLGSFDSFDEQSALMPSIMLAQRLADMPCRMS